MIKLNNKENGYKVVNKYIKEYWNKHGWDDAIVDLETSYDDIIWDTHREIISPIYNWLNNWWKGEKYIRILNIINVNELNIVYLKEREHNKL